MRKKCDRRIGDLYRDLISGFKMIGGPDWRSEFWGSITTLSITTAPQRCISLEMEYGLRVRFHRPSCLIMLPILLSGSDEQFVFALCHTRSIGESRPTKYCSCFVDVLLLLLVVVVVFWPIVGKVQEIGEFSSPSYPISRQKRFCSPKPSPSYVNGLVLNKVILDVSLRKHLLRL